MLVLCRRLGETLRIGDDVVIEITGSNERQGEAELKITAPESTRVVLGEHQAKQGVIITHKRRSRLLVQN